MKITHNENNNWKDEAIMMGVDSDLYPWIEAIIEHENKKAIVEVLRAISLEVAAQGSNKIYIDEDIKLSKEQKENIRLGGRAAYYSVSKTLIDFANLILSGKSPFKNDK